ncbi:YjcZ family sporulation protein [Lysinibacillus xylanilyticus]
MVVVIVLHSRYVVSFILLIIVGTSFLRVYKYPKPLQMLITIVR